MILLTLSVHARERRQLGDEVINATRFTITELGEPVVEYDVLKKSRELQRQALLAFENQQYDDCESCFSLAFKASPNSKDIIVEYIFSSLLAPVVSPAYSVKRAKQLMVHLESIKGEELDRYWIAKALIALADQDKLKAMECLKLSTDGKYEQAKLMISTSMDEGKSFDQSLMDELLPVRKAPREKRSQRY